MVQNTKHEKAPNKFFFLFTNNRSQYLVLLLDTHPFYTDMHNVKRGGKKIYDKSR